jgi:hypothetical protein
MNATRTRRVLSLVASLIAGCSHGRNQLPEASQRDASFAPDGGQAGAAAGGGSGSAASGGGAGSGGRGVPRAGSAADDAGTTSPDAKRSACKRGVAYGFDPDAAVADLTALAPGVAWYYGWANGPNAQLANEYARLAVEFVPMVWGGKFTVDDVIKKIPDDAHFLLGFNEPNFNGSPNKRVGANWALCR